MARQQQPVGERAALRADCSRCQGLCCVVPTFARSADFAITKPAGVPCPNLGGDHRCTIHDRLVDRGFAGCAAFDCFGAGQQVCSVTFAGHRWRDDTDVAASMFAVFEVMRGLHALLWYLDDALGRPDAAVVHASLEEARQRVSGLAGSDEATVRDVVLDAVRGEIGPLLRQASLFARSASRIGGRAGPGTDRAGADLTGADLRDADLIASCLRGVVLLGADLRGADLRCADVLGADLRGARLTGADLRGALYLTVSQLGSARTDAATRVSPRFLTPAASP